jgi:hypothetical protein
MEMAKKQPGKNKRGFVLSLVATMVVLLSVVGLGLLRLGLSARMQAARNTAEMSARAAADAGFTKAVYEMNKNLNIKPWNFSNVAVTADRMLSSANADYTYTIEEIENDSEYKITSTGRSGVAVRTVSATIELQGLFDYALSAAGYAIPKRPKGPKIPGRPKPLKKGGKIEIKGYNAQSYSSGGEEYSGVLQLRTNSKHKRPVKLRGNVIIDGDVIVGPGGDPDTSVEMKDGAEITGDVYAAAEKTEPPAVTLPTPLENKPAQTYNPGDSLSGVARYTELKIRDEQEIHGNCRIYVEGDMKLEDNAKLIIAENASLELYVGGKFEIKKKSQGIDNLSHIPGNLIIYGMDTCRKVKIENKQDFYGAVYAPFAKVEVKNDGDVYGAFVGWDVKLKKKRGSEHGTFYYDQSLRIGDVHSDGTSFIVRSWREE